MPESRPADRNSVQPPPMVVPPSAPPVSQAAPSRVHVHSTDDRTSEDPNGRRRARETTFWMFTAIPSGMCSAVIHLLILIALAICLVTSQLGSEQIDLVIIQTDAVLEEAPLEFPMQMQPSPEMEKSRHPLWESDVFGSTPDVVPIDTEVVLAGTNGRTAAPVLFTTENQGGGGFGPGGNASGSIASRAERRRLALSHGATAESEKAVEQALEWIVRHQRRDGSWSFNHRAGAILCRNCRCGQSGSRSRAENGATAMGLLPLLGAGYTHMQGNYRKQVAQGLRFLINRQRRDGSFIDAEGNMYSHGLATLAICEALAMTRQHYLSPNSAQVQLAPSQNVSVDSQSNDVLFPDLVNPVDDDSVKDSQQRNVRDDGPISLRELTSAAQRAIQFIERAQHSGGGWRYQPGQRGDTSIVGWQMMALKSGQLAELEITPQTVVKAVSFLDSVSQDQIGSCYGYTGGQRSAQLPRNTPIGATTPIGLLCRMYTGWERDHEGINLGVERLQTWARPDQGMYFYYYATQVMHHYGGNAWQKWDSWMRNYLVRQQSQGGSEAGSWKFNGSHDDAGRFYCTSMATMTLEIYYRYVPIYSARAVEVTSSVHE